MFDDVAHGLGWLLLSAAGVREDEGSARLPAGTVTFLLTDVEGSSRRWEAAPEAMAAAVPRHYEILDQALAVHGGVRPVEQGEGDSVVAAFARASDAVAAAVEAQRRLLAEPWPAGADLQVRMAVHTGEAQLRDEGNYFGQTVIRCARLRGIGHGYQILVSDVTAGLVLDRLPDGASLADLGVHRLRDLGRPERVWQVVHPDLPSTNLSLRSLDTHRHNLPVQLTPLIGRENDVAELTELIGGQRLITLTGSGGVGKSRLALAVADEVLELFPGGVWFVELAAVVDQAGVGSALLAALDVHPMPGLQPVEQLAAALPDESTLLLLDNCEHLIEPCAAMTAALLGKHGAVRVLATSREPLGIPGEVTWRVRSLSTPPREAIVGAPSLSQYEAVQLFIDRARRARPTFTVSDANAPAIAQICHRLDGIPLAIELAAARCRQMPAERIARELDDRFRLLTGGARTLLPRQQTMFASIAWSHDRLDDEERMTFRRLGVFSGPFPAEAAAAVVAAGGGIELVEVFDVVSRLVDKCLVVTEEDSGGEARYRLLETLRAFALDRAAIAGELTAVRDAHANWWADWLEPRGAMPTDDILSEIEDFHANLRAALDWSIDRPPVGLRLLRGVAVAWDDLGRADDAMAAADRLLTDDNAEHYGADWLAAAWRTSSLSFHARGPAGMGPLLQRIEAVATRRGDEFYRHLPHIRSEPRIHDAAWRDLARQQGDRYVDAWLPLAAAQDLAEDDPVAAIAVLDEAAATAQASGMRSLREWSRVVQAEVACSTGDLEVAIGLIRGLLEGPFTSWWSDAVRLVSFAALLARDETALHLAAEAGERALRTSPGPGLWAGNGTHRLGLLHGHPSVVSDLRHPPPPTCATLWLVGRESIDAGFPQVAVDHARFWGRPQPHPRAVVAAIEGAATGDEDRWHDALAIALEHGLRLIGVDALEGLAAAASRVESWAECLRLLGSAQRLRDETGYRWRFPFEDQTVELARTAAADALGDTADAAVADGHTLDWREAGAYARRARGERKRPQHGWASLTPTELQVVPLVAEGMTNAQIAERLLMGRATVKTHLEHIFTKLGIRSRAELAAEATRRAPQ